MSPYVTNHGKMSSGHIYKILPTWGHDANHHFETEWMAGPMIYVIMLATKYA